ncbi:MAG: hypothetical protein J2O48_13860 [Solirubrobacterales bacterium]|nr:hypothetical protein [Solirubrobacterales bacterium]
MPPLDPELQLRSLDVNGIERSYWIPDRRARGADVGVIFALHAEGETGPKLARRTELSHRAREAGFNIVFPDALERVWDDHGSGRRDRADDDHFIRALVDSLRRRNEFSGAGPFLVGYGENGACFAERLAREGVHELSGALLIGGTAREASRALTPTPARPLPVELVDPPAPGPRKRGLRVRLALKDSREHALVAAETIRADWAGGGALPAPLLEICNAGG